MRKFFSRYKYLEISDKKHKKIYYKILKKYSWTDDKRYININYKVNLVNRCEELKRLFDENWPSNTLPSTSRLHSPAYLFFNKNKDTLV